jgi:hypothetical protein
MMAVLVFILYIQSPQVTKLYRHPDLLWLITPFLIYWFSRIWLLAGRGKVNSDPVVFAIRDRVAYVIGIAVAVLLAMAV